jgi:hypothetical protein
MNSFAFFALLALISAPPERLEVFLTALHVFHNEDSFPEALA